jgi:peptidoglycan DL-endopeptidase CwlO
VGERAGRRRFGAGAASLVIAVALVLASATTATAATPTPSPSPTSTRGATTKPTAHPTSTPTRAPSPAPNPTRSAAPPPTPRPTRSAAPPPVIVYPTLPELLAAQRNERTKAAEVTRIGEQVIALQHQADAAGKASQRADEHYLRARTAVDDALAAREAAQKEAVSAAATAHTSRTRASALAAQLARTDLGTLPLSLVLNSRVSGGTLQGLSAATQLSSVAARVYRQAVLDERAAKVAKAAAAVAAKRAVVARAAAAKAAAAARKASESTAAAVHITQQHEQELVLDLAVLRRTTEQVACDYLAGKHHQPRCDAKRIAETATTPGGKVVAFARAQIGDPYVFAAAGPTDWDCSGLTMGAYASIGIDIGPHSATAQYELERAEGHLVPFSAAQPGDLIFYTDGGGDMFHTTIYSGDGMMIEAPYAGADVREVPVRADQLVQLVARPAA